MLSSLKGEYETVKELGADILAINVDSAESHESFCQTLGGCPFPLASDADLEVTRLYDAVGEDGKRGRRAVFVLDKDGIIVHLIPWYQPGNVGQFMEVFQALGM